MARRPRPSPSPPESVLERCVLSPEQQAALHRTLGDRVKAARLELGLTQEQLGRALGRTQPWVREVESGRTAAQPYVLAALAAATARSVGWFFGEPERAGRETESRPGG